MTTIENVKEYLENKRKAVESRIEMNDSNFNWLSDEIRVLQKDKRTKKYKDCKELLDGNERRDIKLRAEARFIRRMIKDLEI